MPRDRRRAQAVGCSSESTVQLAARPTKVMTSSASCLASCAPLPSWMTIWRHRGTASTFGSGLRSSPPMRSSSARCSARTPVSSTPLSRRPHRNSAPGVSRRSSLAMSSERDGPCFDHFFRRLPRVGERGDVKVARQREAIAVAADDDRRRGTDPAKRWLLVCGHAGHGSSGTSEIRCKKGPDTICPASGAHRDRYSVFESSHGLCAVSHTQDPRSVEDGPVRRVRWLWRQRSCRRTTSFRPDRITSTRRP